MFESMQGPNRSGADKAEGVLLSVLAVLSVGMFVAFLGLLGGWL
jgi:hypothetical protein